jgi:hypothetical protein
VASASESFLIRPPDLWQLPADTYSSKAGEIWVKEWPLNFAYEVLLF